MLTHRQRKCRGVRRPGLREVGVADRGGALREVQPRAQEEEPRAEDRAAAGV